MTSAAPRIMPLKPFCSASAGTRGLRSAFNAANAGSRVEFPQKAPREGFEPPTLCLEGRCSIH